MHRILSVFLAAGFSVSAGGLDEQLLAAARSGDLTTARALIEEGASIETTTAYGQTPLYLAAMNGQEEVVRFLLEKGANTEVRDSFYKATILAFTVQRKHYGVAKLLIAKSKTSVDEDLRGVASTGNAELVQAVLDRGKASQAALDRTYETALERKQTAVSELLRKAGAQEPAPPAPVDAKVLESYTGTYKSDQIPIEVKVFTRDGKLFMQAAGQNEIAFKARSATAYQFLPAQIEVEFDSASSFNFRQATTTAKFKKVMAQ